MARTMTVTTVTPTRTGNVFQIGRPSGASQIAFAARMNAATYPLADHNASASPTTNMRPPALRFFERPVTALVRMSLAGPGVNAWRFVSSEFVAAEPSRRTTEASALCGGKTDSTPEG